MFFPVKESAGIATYLTGDTYNMKYSEWIKIGLLYLLLVCGGLWHILNVFQSLMDTLASSLIILLGGWIFIENLRLLARQTPESGHYRLVVWALLVLVSSIGLEWLGVKTGLIFGVYQYGENLPPYIGGVPIAIGFAWLGMLLASSAVVQKFFPRSFEKRVFLPAVLIAFFMTVFDAFMEPAATRLLYWTWQDHSVPLQNYLAWFAISFGYAYCGIQYFRILTPVSSLGVHLYISQLFYFILIYLS